MPHCTYLIIGGGMTADAAVQGIREMDPHTPFRPEDLKGLIPS
jgi:hypothetical protein